MQEGEETKQWQEILHKLNSLKNKGGGGHFKTKVPHMVTAYTLNLLNEVTQTVLDALKMHQLLFPWLPAVECHCNTNL